MTRPFTGWHMLATMVGFFGIVIAVNVLMARDAIHTFSGEVVENSYVASQRFNHWLADARSQQAEGWSATIGADPDRHLTVTVLQNGHAVPVSSVSVEADQPLDTILPTQPPMRALGAGRFQSAKPIGTGRWQVRVQAKAGVRMLRFEQDIAV